jgi:hypothetical protein
MSVPVVPSDLEHNFRPFGAVTTWTDIELTLPRFRETLKRRQELQRLGDLPISEAVRGVVWRLARAFLRGELPNSDVTILCTDTIGTTTVTNALAAQFGLSDAISVVPHLVGDAVDGFAKGHLAASPDYVRTAISRFTEGEPPILGDYIAFRTSGDEHLAVCVQSHDDATPFVDDHRAEALGERYRAIVSTHVRSPLREFLMEQSMGLRWGTARASLSDLATASFDANAERYSPSENPKHLALTLMQRLLVLVQEADGMCRVWPSDKMRQGMSGVSVARGEVALSGTLAQARENSETNAANTAAPYLGLKFGETPHGPPMYG